MAALTATAVTARKPAVTAQLRLPSTVKTDFLIASTFPRSAQSLKAEIRVRAYRPKTLRNKLG